MTLSTDDSRVFTDPLLEDDESTREGSPQLAPTTMIGGCWPPTSAWLRPQLGGVNSRSISRDSATAGSQPQNGSPTVIGNPTRDKPSSSSFTTTSSSGAAAGAAAVAVGGGGRPPHAMMSSIQTIATKSATSTILVPPPSRVEVAAAAAAAAKAKTRYSPSSPEGHNESRAGEQGGATRPPLSTQPTPANANTTAPRPKLSVRVDPVLDVNLTVTAVEGQFNRDSSPVFIGKPPPPPTPQKPPNHQTTALSSCTTAGHRPTPTIATSGMEPNSISSAGKRSAVSAPEVLGSKSLLAGGSSTLGGVGRKGQGGGSGGGGGGVRARFAKSQRLAEIQNATGLLEGRAVLGPSGSPQSALQYGQKLSITAFPASSSSSFDEEEEPTDDEGEMDEEMNHGVTTHHSSTVAYSAAPSSAVVALLNVGGDHGGMSRLPVPVSAGGAGGAGGGAAVASMSISSLLDNGPRTATITDPKNSSHSFLLHSVANADPVKLHPSAQDRPNLLITTTTTTSTSTATSNNNDANSNAQHSCPFDGQMMDHEGAMTRADSAAALETGKGAMLLTTDDTPSQTSSSSSPWREGNHLHHHHQRHHLEEEPEAHGAIIHATAADLPKATILMTTTTTTTTNTAGEAVSSSEGRSRSSMTDSVVPSPSPPPPPLTMAVSSDSGASCSSPFRVTAAPATAGVGGDVTAIGGSAAATTATAAATGPLFFSAGRRHFGPPSTAGGSAVSGRAPAFSREGSISITDSARGDVDDDDEVDEEDLIPGQVSSRAAAAAAAAASAAARYARRYSRRGSGSGTGWISPGPTLSSATTGRGSQCSVFLQRPEEPVLSEVEDTANSAEEEAGFVDEFGFVLDEKSKIKEDLYVKNVDGCRVLRAEVKWASIASDWTDHMAKKAEFIKRRCRKGIPGRFRGVAWQLLLQSRQHMNKAESVGIYTALRDKKLSPAAQEVDDIIARDLDRTFPTHVLFREKDGTGQRFLRHVLHAYAAADPEVGYVQGMGFVVCALSTQLDEEETFWALHMLMHQEKWQLRELYRPDFPMLHQFFYQLKRLLAKIAPRLHRRFEEFSIEPSFYASQWFMTVFVGVLSFRALLRVWDVFLYEGWKMIFRIALALLKDEEPHLLELPYDELLLALKALNEKKNADKLMRDALNIKFKTAALQRYKKEYWAAKAAGTVV